MPIKRNVDKTKEQYFNKALEICRKGGCLTIADVVAFMPISTRTFYKFFPAGSDEHFAIKEALSENITRSKVSIRSKLYSSGNVTALITLYKMMATPEERDAISMVRTDLTTNGKDIKADPLIIEVIDKREQVDAEDTDDKGIQ